jgi:SAM-dependent methyltransferase
MGKARIRRLLFRRGWDTRCRHFAAARTLRNAITGMPTGSGPELLDVGCGVAGLAAFMPDVEVMGVDLAPPQEPLANLTFTPGTITALPFSDKSFGVACCIDVLQYLPIDARTEAISELVRVARDGVLIACPHGKIARDCDAGYERALVARGRAVPEWISEPRPHPYPTQAGVVEMIREADSGARTSISFCESVSACRLLRVAAARSTALYVATNLVLGALLPVMPDPAASSAYRFLAFAEL